jgi:two-component system sensor histidine kinase DegS
MAISEVKSIVYKIAPSSLNDFGLIASLKMLCEISNEEKLKVEFTEKGDYERFDEYTEINLYRIAQETLNNAIKHSSASKININVSIKSDIFTLKIIDNGIGINKNILNNKTGGNGLINMQERANSIGADFKINSKNKQTIISISIKLNDK